MHQDLISLANAHVFLFREQEPGQDKEKQGVLYKTLC